MEKKWKNIKEDGMYKIIKFLIRVFPDLKNYEFVHDSDLNEFYDLFKDRLKFIGVKLSYNLDICEFTVWVRSTLLANMEIIASGNLEMKDFIFLPLNNIKVYGKSDVREYKTEYHKGVVHAVTKKDAHDIVSWFDEDATFFWDEMEMYDYDTYDSETVDLDYTNFTIEGPVNESKTNTKKVLSESSNKSKRLRQINQFFNILNEDEKNYLRSKLI